MKIEVFMALLFVGSVLTSLITEGVKKMMENVARNGITAIIAVIVGVLIGLYYCDTAISDPSILTIITIIGTFVIGSWLCAMLGYDKVKQYLFQLKEIRERKNTDEE